MIKISPRCAWPAGVAAALMFGCSTPADGDSGGNQNADAGAGYTGVEIYPCVTMYDCVQDAGHLGPPPAEHLRCGGELVASGMPGAVLFTSRPGPYPTVLNTLTVLYGDGTAVTHSRSRCDTVDGCAGQNTAAWSYSGPPQLCDVEVQPADIASCDQADGPCSWTAGSLANCVPIPDSWSCQDLP